MHNRRTKYPPDDRPWPCPGCGYDLRASFGVDDQVAACPECGRKPRISEFHHRPPIVRINRLIAILFRLPSVFLIVISMLGFRGGGLNPFWRVADDALVYVFFVSPFYLFLPTILAIRHHHSFGLRFVVGLLLLFGFSLINTLIVLFGEGLLDQLL